MSNYVALPGAIANGDMSTFQFAAVTLTGSVDFEVQGTTAATQIPVGVLQNDPDTSGHAAEVAISGVAKMRYGGTVTAGNFLVVDANGFANASSTADEEHIIGRALQDGTSTGIYYVLLQPSFLYTT